MLQCFSLHLPHHLSSTYLMNLQVPPPIIPPASSPQHTIHKMASYNFHRLLLLFLYSSLSTVTLAVAGIPAVIVFGDSTVDTGNNNHIETPLKSDFQPYGRDFFGGQPTGRFCNGRLATDFLLEGLGLGPVVPAYLDPAYGIEDFAVAVCFASAGTGFDNATSDVLNVIPLWKEVEFFKAYQRRLKRYAGNARAKQIVSEALYIISIGTNDFLENYYAFITGRFKQFTVEQFEDFLVDIAGDFLVDIYLLGARKILFAGLSPIGCLPLERTTNVAKPGSCMEKYNKVARDFNAKLVKMIDKLCAALPGIKLRYSNVYDALRSFVENPSQYGFENVGEGCCGTGKFELGYLCSDLSPYTCPDADKYVWWDAFHPTEKANRLLADLTLNRVRQEFL